MPSDEKLRQMSIMELCELIENMARIIHNQQEIIELLYATSCEKGGAV